MTAAGRIVVAAVLVLAGSLAMLWAGTGPLELLAGTVRLLVMAAAVTAAGLALSALRPRNAAPAPASAPCGCPCGCPAPGHRDDDGTPGRCDPCRMNIHQEA